MMFLSTKGTRCFTKALLLNVLACTALVISAAANASSISVFMDLSNNQEVYPDGTNYLEVTISDGNNGDIDFSVTTLGALHNFVPDWNNFGISAFKFNFGSSGATINNILRPFEWVVSEDYENGESWLEFGLFDAFMSGEYLKNTLRFSIFGVDGDTPQDYLPTCNPGGQNPGEVYPDVVSLNPCGVHFVAKVMGLSTNPNFKDIWPMDPSTGPVKFAGPAIVPLPPAAWLFISAIAMLVWMRRRNNARSEELHGLPG